MAARATGVTSSEISAGSGALSNASSFSSYDSLEGFQEVWYRVFGTFALLSMIGSLVVMSMYIFVPATRTHPSTTLVFLLVFCDFWFSLQYVANGYSTSPNDVLHNWVCILQGCWLQFFGIGSVSWNAVISVNLLLMMRNAFANGKQYHKFYHAWVWSLAIGTTLAIYLMGQIGDTGEGVCWIKHDVFPGWFYMFVLAYLIVAAATLIFGLSRMHEMSSISTNIRHKMMGRMMLYVGVFLVCWLFPTVQHLICFFLGSKYSKFLGILTSLGMSIQGLCNAVVWITSPQFYRHFVRLILKVCRRNKQEYTPLNESTPGGLAGLDDFQKVDAALRREILRIMLIGAQVSLSDDPNASLCTTPEYVEWNLDCYSCATVTSSARHIQQHTEEPNKKKDLSNPVVTSFKFVKFHEFSPALFLQLRQQFGVTEFYKASLDPETVLSKIDLQKFSEGRSGSFFVFTPDKRFIIKTLPANEATLLQKILPFYVSYLLSNPKSLIVRFYGLYCVSLTSHTAVYTVVMANMFFGSKTLNERYDLKGSWVHRKVGKKHDQNPSTQGMDLDLHRKLHLDSTTRSFLDLQLRSDAQFLCSLGIMDYSILLGFHFAKTTGDQANKIRDRRDTWRSAKIKASPSTSLLSTSLSASLALSTSVAASPLMASSCVPPSTMPVGSPTTLVKSTSCDFPGSPHQPTREESSADDIDSEPEPLFTGSPEAFHGAIIPMTQTTGTTHTKPSPDPGIPSIDSSEFYYLSIIDILQLYDTQKKLERFWKVSVMRKDPDGVSVQEPSYYLDRFLYNWGTNLLADEAGDPHAPKLPSENPSETEIEGILISPVVNNN